MAKKTVKKCKRSSAVKRKCPECGSANLVERKKVKGPHYAQVKCKDCKRHVQWVSKPDSEKTRRPQAHRDLVKRYSRGYCEVCGTRKEDLPAGQAMEANHIIEFKNGGSDERENIQILCTACHKLIHCLRTHFRPR